MLAIEKPSVVKTPVWPCVSLAIKSACDFAHSIRWPFLGDESNTGNDTSKTSTDEACCTCYRAFGMSRDIVGLEGEHARYAELEEPNT